MPGITNPAEEYFKDGLWGWAATLWEKLTSSGGRLYVALHGWDTVAEAWRKLRVTPDTNILDVNVASEVEVTQLTSGELLTGIHGWDGANWRKLPLVWGFSSQYREAVDKTDASADSDGLTTTPVAAGEVWVITNIACYDLNTALTKIEVDIYDGVTRTRLGSKVTVPASEVYAISGLYPLIQDDYVQVTFTGTVLNDDISVHIVGYKMKIAT